jgi:hypothetical protein
MVNAWTKGTVALLITGLTGCNTFDPPPNRNFDTSEPNVLDVPTTKDTASGPPIVTTLGVGPVSTFTNTSTGFAQGSTASATGSGADDDSQSVMTDAGEVETSSVGPILGTDSTGSDEFEASGSPDAGSFDASSAAESDTGGSADVSSDLDAGLIDAAEVDAGPDASD